MSERDYQREYQTLGAEMRYRLDERAAIREFDGGQDRATAERRAWREVVEGQSRASMDGAAEWRAKRQQQQRQR